MGGGGEIEMKNKWEGAEREKGKGGVERVGRRYVTC